MNTGLQRESEKMKTKRARRARHDYLLEYWEIARKDPEWLEKNHIPPPSFWEQFKEVCRCGDWIWFVLMAWIIFKIFYVIRYGYGPGDPFDPRYQ